MSKKQAGFGQVKARVLTDGAYGKVNEVIVIADEEAKQALEAGWLDSSPDAVSYVESLVPADETVVE